MHPIFTRSEENYIKAIYHLQAESGTVTTNALAEKLQTRPASVTDMMKKLKAKNLLHYKPYYGFSLSAEGKRSALFIIRRHRLWEHFLAEKLGFGWDEVHSLAEELEHVSSKKLIDRLDEYLEFPSVDPHGDPIPDKKGRMTDVQKIRLSDLPLHRVAAVCQVQDQSDEILELLQHKQISLGTKIEIRRQFDYDKSIEVKTRHGLVTISNQLAENIFVKYEAAQN